MTRRKIKLLDSDDLRNHLDSYYQVASQETCAQFGRDLVAHLIKLTGSKVGQEPDIEAGWAVSQACLAGQARMHDVRQAGFKIHALAKQAENPLEQALLRVIGHAVATSHMKEHAMVASDYAIKLINLAYPDDLSAVQKERQWQLDWWQDKTDYDRT
ncbi:putative immunity protein [Abiotrophia defectiva]|uniref:putative immunity protein n=1 Tax=Abiotrophia defectiva TaxID=46125 RepID=UPI0028D0EFCE|nr:hypothetical protein [Abiotrophia defectiva]